MNSKFNSKQIIDIQTKSSQTKVLIILILHDGIYKGKAMKQVKICHFGMWGIFNRTQMRANTCNKKHPQFPWSEQNFWGMKTTIKLFSWELSQPRRIRKISVYQNEPSQSTVIKITSSNSFLCVFISSVSFSSQFYTALSHFFVKC